MQKTLDKKVEYILFLQSRLKEVKMKKNELVRKLRAAGCYIYRNGASHEVWYSPISDNLFSVPRHGAKEMATGTVKSISERSGVDLL